MADKAARGTKRTCQNDECGSRFYDLNREPIVCPICGGIYQIAHGPVVAETAEAIRAKSKKTEFEAQDTEAEAPLPEGDEALAEIEAEEPAAAAGDETFLEEEEEDGGDMSNIIGGPVEGDEEP
jgi:uncharacterized protein (TIGR02300 family)